jgi:ribokinase
MILVFGSINTDLIMRVPRLPRPGETQLCPGYMRSAGGKGANQAAAAARAGAPVRLVGAVGDDDFGRFALASLRDAGVDVAGVAQVDAPTACASIWVDDAAENAIVVASGANLQAEVRQVDESMLGAGVTLLTQMELRASETWAALARARIRGARTLLNLAPVAPVTPEGLATLEWLFVNEPEARSVGHDLRMLDGTTPGQVAAVLQQRHGVATVVTLGGAGALAVTAEGLWRIGALPVTPVDTAGAGDAFVGGFAACLDRGGSLPEALRWGITTGGLACAAAGTQTSLPTRAAIEAALGRAPAPELLRLGGWQG